MGLVPFRPEQGKCQLCLALIAVLDFTPWLMARHQMQHACNARLVSMGKGQVCPRVAYVGLANISLGWGSPTQHSVMHVPKVYILQCLALQIAHRVLLESLVH